VQILELRMPASRWLQAAAATLAVFGQPVKSCDNVDRGGGGAEVWGVEKGTEIPGMLLYHLVARGLTFFISLLVF
jgi:hypothetical protein